MITLALFTVLARAEEPVVIDPSDVPETANVRYAPVTEVDMAGADVNAHVVGPSVEWVHEVGKPWFPPMFHPREEFDGEMSTSVAEIR